MYVADKVQFALFTLQRRVSLAYNAVVEMSLSCLQFSGAGEFNLFTVQ